MKTIFKDYLRTVGKSFHRFLSILLIVALGAGFFAGLKSTGPDMRETADAYYAQANLMDLRVMGNYGLDDGDVELLRGLEGVKGASGGYEADVLNELSGDNLRVMSLPEEGGLNTPNLVEGRLPENERECVVDAALLGVNYEIGKTLYVHLKDSRIEDVLNVVEFTIVGAVGSPLYTSRDRGVSTIGNGISNGFFMVLPQVFVAEYYTEAYVRFTDSDRISSFSGEYDSFVADRRGMIQAALTEGMEDRHERLSEGPRKKIADAEAVLEEAERLYEQGERNLAEGEAELAEAEQIQTVGEQELNEARQVVEEMEASVVALEEEIAALEEDIARIDEEIQAREAVQAEEKEVLDAEEEAYQASYNVNKGSQKTEEERRQLQRRRDELDESFLAWEQEAAAIQGRRADIAALETRIAGIQGEIRLIQSDAEEATALYEEVVEAQERKESRLSESRAKIEQAKKDLEDTEANVIGKEEEVNEATLELSRMEKIYYYVTDRSLIPGYGEYGANANRVDAIATVFPIFFIVIAALVCLTTMTRMVEEETVLIGTYKALGYGKGVIIGKYLGYSFAATVLGSAVGLTLGFKVFPSVIMRAYRTLYNMPATETPFRLDYTLGVLGVGLGVTLITSFAACWKELKTGPAQLMRPKMPRKGKHIWLEKIPGLWKIMTFNMKVTARNLFRYKRRMLMTILGIAGGAALMLTGFGFRNALTDVVELQYGEIFRYDMMVSLDENADYYQRMTLDTLIRNSSAKNLYIYEKSMDVMANDRLVNVSMIVGENDNPMDDFITLRTRDGHEPVELSGDSVVLTEKLAQLLKVGVGDVVAFKDTSNNQYMATVTGITENYVDHYIYMGEFIYSQYFGSVPEYTTVLIKLSSTNVNEINLVSESLNRMEFIRSSIVMSVVRQQYIDLIDSMNILVYALIFSAALLAFVVLYNLSAINMSERMRELSTMKVIGHYNWELTAYIGRENIVLTVVGILLGLVAGVFLCSYVVTTAEVDGLMFGRDIRGGSFALAALLTMGFALLVNVVMAFSLRKIDMVKALKSVE